MIEPSRHLGDGRTGIVEVSPDIGIRHGPMVRVLGGIQNSSLMETVMMEPIEELYRGGSEVVKGQCGGRHGDRHQVATLGTTFHEI